MNPKPVPSPNFIPNWPEMVQNESWSPRAHFSPQSQQESICQMTPAFRALPTPKKYEKKAEITREYQSGITRPSYQVLESENNRFSQRMDTTRRPDQDQESSSYISDWQRLKGNKGQQLKENSNSEKFRLSEEVMSHSSHSSISAKNQSQLLITETANETLRKVESSRNAKAKSFQFHLPEKNQKTLLKRSLAPLNIQDQSEMPSQLFSKEFEVSQIIPNQESGRNPPVLNSRTTTARMARGKCCCPGADLNEFGTCPEFSEIFKREITLHESKVLFKHDDEDTLQKEFTNILKNQRETARTPLVNSLRRYFKRGVDDFPDLDSITEAMEHHCDSWSAFWLIVHLVEKLKLDRKLLKNSQIHFGKIENLLFSSRKDLFTRLFMLRVKPENYARQWIASALLGIIPQDQNVLLSSI